MVREITQTFNLAWKQGCDAERGLSSRLLTVITSSVLANVRPSNASIPNSYPDSRSKSTEFTGTNFEGASEVKDVL